MKFKKLGLLLLLFVSVFAVSFVACGDDDEDKPISESKLPGAATDFLTRYYPDIQVLSVIKDTDDSKVEYDVVLANGHDITFDSKGDWLDVDAPFGQTIPDGIAPAAINSYISQNYSGNGINEIGKENFGYDVELTNGIGLMFNFAGEYIGVDR